MTKASVTEDLRRSWLIQRLKQPFPNTGTAARWSEAFSFGGGLVNGGLSNEAMGLLREVFRFDYMGSAEFEFGAVPEALQRIAKAKHLDAFEITIPLNEVAPSWREPKGTQRSGDATVYVLCPKPMRQAVEQRIRDVAARRTDHKERPGLDSSLRPTTEWDAEVCGWLELDNGFMFFTDRDMWAKTAGLFGVAVTS
jgi:hypothetical protein